MCMIMCCIECGKQLPPTSFNRRGKVSRSDAKTFGERLVQLATQEINPRDFMCVDCILDEGLKCEFPRD